MSALRVLPTKLYAPRCRQGTVERPDLVRRIERGTWRALTLIVAPAGYGKTTLVTQWMSQTGMPVAWLSLDAADNEPLRFLSYVLASIGRIRPEVAAKLDGVAQSTGEVSIEALFAELLVIPLAEETSAFALVLDDVHELGNQAVIDALDWLLDHLPPSMHVLVTSRVEPGLSLPTRRARDGVTEIHATDLAFTADEALAFFNGAMELGLDADSAGKLQRRTEGWVAGMQLASLSLKRGAQVRDVLDALSADSDVADYLIKEILDGLDAEQRSFLLDISVLDRFSAPLCEALVVNPAAGQFLRRAVHDGLFLVPLDHRRQWYRYHHLFGDILGRRLRQESPEREPLLQRRAARWWVAQDDPHSAATLAIRAGAHDLLGEIAERWAMPTLLRSDRASVERWLAALPTRAMDEFPMVGAVAGWVSVLPVRSHPRVEAALDAVKRSRAALDTTAVAAERRDEVEGHLIAIETIATRPVGDHAACITHAEAAHQRFADGGFAGRTVVALQIGVLHVMLGQLREAITPLRDAEAWGRRSNNPFAGIAAMSYRAWAHRLLGDLDEADSACSCAMAYSAEVGTTKMGLAGHVHIERARIRFERWDLPGALGELEEAIPRIRLLSDPFRMTTALVLQARVRAAAGDVELADASCHEAVACAAHDGHPLLQAWARTGRWSVGLARNEPVDVPLIGTGEYRCSTHDAALLPALGAIARGRGADVLELSEQLRARSLESEWVSHALDWSVVRALALHAAAHPGRAAQALAEAIRVGRQRYFIRPFAEWRLQLGSIVPTLPDPERAFMERMAPRKPRRSAPRTPTTPAATAQEVPPLPEPLSPRELEVLAHVREGKTNPEIAQALFVSTGTIKTHMHRLMTKLQAKNRVEAIRLAAAYGLHLG